MINIIPSNQRYHANIGWLDTHWHFSFSDYYDPDNMNWSALRVFNDDVVQPQTGFDLHPHRDMEIVTYVIDGELTHQDSSGNKGVIRPGEVQVMSAGRGIMHSEKNGSTDRPVHLLQLWLMPRHKGNTPRWEQKQFAPATVSANCCRWSVPRMATAMAHSRSTRTRRSTFRHCRPVRV